MLPPMPAALHVASYTAPGAARLLARIPRLHRGLRAAPGVLAGHVFATADYHPLTSGIPTLRRYALLCAFEDDAALADFEGSPLGGAFADGARESWRVTLDASRVVNGSWRGWRPDTGDADGIGRTEPLAKNEPLAVMTYGVLVPRYIPRFAMLNRQIIAGSMNQEGMIVRHAFFDRPLSVCTFSIWRRQADVTRFAYRSHTLHRSAIRPWLDTPWGTDNFFARFRLRDSSGTCDGRDPVADALAAAAVSPEPAERRAAPR